MPKRSTRARCRTDHQAQGKAHLDTGRPRSVAAVEDPVAAAVAGPALEAVDLALDLVVVARAADPGAADLALDPAVVARAADPGAAAVDTQFC